MQAISNDQRIVKNIYHTKYHPFQLSEDDVPGQSYLQLDNSYPQGFGFHIFKMEPGARTTAHTHTCDEQFLMLEGELIDHDGTIYKPGDMVLLKKGTQHWSHSPSGCLIVAFIPTPEEPINQSKHSTNK